MAKTAVKPRPLPVGGLQQDEDIFFATLLKDEDVEVMPMDAYTAASLGYIEHLTRFAAGDLDTANRSGWTPLMYAACLGHTDTVKYLGRRRVSCSFFAGKSDGNEGRRQTALMLAAANGHDDSVSALLALPDCHANATDTRGWTALFYAIAYGHPSTAELLLKNGADPNIPEHSRQASPLAIAAEAGHDDIVRILLRNGGDVNQKTRDGCMPIDIASFRGQVQIVNILHRAQTKSKRATAGNTGSTTVGSDSSSTSAFDKGTSKGKFPGGGNGLAAAVDSDLSKLLSKLALEHYAKVFSANSITYETLMRFSEEDLRQLPFLSVGARKQIMLEISAKQATESKATEETLTDKSLTSKEVESILIPSKRKQAKPTFAHFLGHVSVLVSHCSLLNEDQRHQLIDVVGSSMKQIQASSLRDERKQVNNDAAIDEIRAKMEMINAYFDAFLAQN